VVSLKAEDHMTAHCRPLLHTERPCSRRVRVMVMLGPRFRIRISDHVSELQLYRRQLGFG